MTVPLFTRQCSLIVGDQQLDGLRVAFDVERSATSDPGKATIVVNNLTAETRAALAPKGLRCVLKAGYTDRFGPIFIGSTFRVTSRIEGVDWVTRIEAADGGKEVAAGVGAWSFAARSSVADAIRRIALGLGLPLSTGSVIAPTKPTTGGGRAPSVAFASSWAFAGRTSSALDRITGDFGLTWSIQDGQVQILPRATGDGSGTTLLSPSTGLVGSPERSEEVAKKPGAKAKTVVRARCLIQPGIRPEGYILLSSTDTGLSGRHRVLKMKATGDTHGQDWTMALEMEPVAG